MNCTIENPEPETGLNWEPDALVRLSKRENPTEFVLIRILSNDLPPRHLIGQTASNLRFMLENEKAFPDCTNLWVLNRIFNKTQEKQVIQILEDFKQTYQVIPFNLREWTNAYEEKGINFATHYATGVNTARNIIIKQARQLGHKYILGWDGNEYLTISDFKEIRDEIYNRPDCEFHFIPIVRVPGNNEEHLLMPNNHSWEVPGEPQVVLRGDSEITYDEGKSYGAESKVSLLKTLIASDKRNCSSEFGRVYRLYSGGDAREFPQKELSRGRTRRRAIILFHTMLYARAKECLDFTETEEEFKMRTGSSHAHVAHAIRKEESLRRNLWNRKHGL